MSKLASLSEPEVGLQTPLVFLYECSTGPETDQAVKHVVNQALPAAALNSARDATGQ
jgi:hypothetical protein